MSGANTVDGAVVVELLERANAAGQHVPTSPKAPRPAATVLAAFGNLPDGVSGRVLDSLLSDLEAQGVVERRVVVTRYRKRREGWDVRADVGAEPAPAADRADSAPTAESAPGARELAHGDHAAPTSVPTPATAAESQLLLAMVKVLPAPVLQAAMAAMPVPVLKAAVAALPARVRRAAHVKARIALTGAVGLEAELDMAMACLDRVGVFRGVEASRISLLRSRLAKGMDMDAYLADQFLGADVGERLEAAILSGLDAATT